MDKDLKAQLDEEKTNLDTLAKEVSTTNNAYQAATDASGKKREQAIQAENDKGKEQQRQKILLVSHRSGGKISTQSMDAYLKYTKWSIESNETCQVGPYKQKPSSMSSTNFCASSHELNLKFS
jgi:hypothetical protein